MVFLLFVGISALLLELLQYSPESKIFQPLSSESGPGGKKKEGASSVDEAIPLEMALPTRRIDPCRRGCAATPPPRPEQRILPRAHE